MTAPEPTGEATKRAGDRGLPGAPPPPRPPARPVTWQKLTFLPAVLVGVLLATWLWFRRADLDPVSRSVLAGGQVSGALWRHVGLTVVSTLLVLAVAVPLGVLLTRGPFRGAVPAVAAPGGTGRVVPAIGLLALVAVWLGGGRRAALIGIVAYAVPPVLSHVVAGLNAGDPAAAEAARRLGMSPWDVLVRVELPPAVPLILAGVRTALVLNVGTATLAAFAGGGGLGVLIATGVVGRRMPVLVLGSVLTVVLALLADWLASLAELLLRPRDPEADG
ncbi:ABC transporter permease [Streptomyces sp. NPDC051041]|uniref:ABC transporter permease n=1 Tax=Streptomyces sp. NPDC051041 TaxID=3365640 RepID=UPI0037A61C8F